MTTRIESQSVSPAWRGPRMVSTTGREYLYFIAYSAKGGFGNCYLPLSFEIDCKVDVEWVRDQLREQGLPDAVILSFALLPGGWGS